MVDILNRALAAGRNYLGIGGGEDEAYVDGYGEEDYAYHVETDAPESSVTLRAHSAVNQTRGGNMYSVRTYIPTGFSEAREIGRSFREGHITIVNLSNLNTADGNRIVDFMSGLIFALRGKHERTHESVWILTPHGIDLNGDSTYTDSGVL
jgi:cell division inhibitor SepF